MSNSSDMKQATEEFISLLEQMADDAKSLVARMDDRPALGAARLRDLAGHYEKLSQHFLDAAFELIAIRSALETPSLEDADRAWEATLERTRARAVSIEGFREGTAGRAAPSPASARKGAS